MWGSLFPWERAGVRATDRTIQAAQPLFCPVALRLPGLQRAPRRPGKAKPPPGFLLALRPPALLSRKP
ncbi:hypothetical protein DP202_19200 [Enterobacter cloacae]|uniref:Uncharacterized protein n=1 Tax=Enterobacter cloacae TaxID=550 RepID=A0A330G706_ENTCL|nr:hypothetical protein DP202_19200 [Enterobacter cloacae]